MSAAKQEVYLQLGSNIGEREKNVQAAGELISQMIGTIVAASSLYETEAWGVTDQPDFINQVLKVTTTLSPEQILKQLEHIEEQLGRVRERKWGERLIDIDILLYSNQIIQTEQLTIPHRELQNRNFVLIPLMELAPELEHPVLKQTIEELYWDSKDELEVIKIDDARGN